MKKLSVLLLLWLLSLLQPQAQAQETEVIPRITGINVSHDTGYTKGYFIELDVSGCTALQSLYCRDNQLTKLDVSKNTELVELYCYNNELTKLDVSKNTELVELYCYNNELTKLDVSKNTELVELYCYNNELTKLDVSKNTELVHLNCRDNQITDTLDMSNCTDLLSLDCRNNEITVLNVWGCTSLGRRVNDNSSYYYVFYISGNPLVSLDMSRCRNVKSFPGSGTTLRFFNAEGSGLSSIPYLPMLEVLDVSNCPNLDSLFVKGDSLSELKVKDCSSLKKLSCKGVKISQLDMTGCTSLKWLYLDSNQLRTIQGNSNVLQTFEGANNHLPFSQLFPFMQRRPLDAQYRLSPQRDTVCLSVNEAFDLQKEMRMGLATTLWTVSSLDDAAVPEGTCVEKNGVFSFSKPGKYKLVLLNDYNYGANSLIEFIWYVKVTTPPLTANEDLQEGKAFVYTKQRVICLSEPMGVVQVFNMFGQCVYSGTNTKIPVKTSGLYVVRFGTQTHKVIVK